MLHKQMKRNAMLTKQQRKSEALRTMIASTDFINGDLNETLESFKHRAQIFGLVVEELVIDPYNDWEINRELKGTVHTFQNNSIHGREHIYFYTTTDWKKFTLTRFGVTREPNSLIQKFRLQRNDTSHFFEKLWREGDLEKHCCERITFTLTELPEFSKTLRSRFLQYLRDTYGQYSLRLKGSYFQNKGNTTYYSLLIDGESVHFGWTLPSDNGKKHKKTIVSIYREHISRGPFTELNFQSVIMECYRELIKDQESVKGFYEELFAKDKAEKRKENQGLFRYILNWLFKPTR